MRIKKITAIKSLLLISLIYCAQSNQATLPNNFNNCQVSLDQAVEELQEIKTQNELNFEFRIVREVTERALRKAGIPFDMLIMGFADTGRVLINDINWKGKVKAHAVNMKRDEGFENINWEEYEL